MTGRQYPRTIKVRFAQFVFWHDLTHVQILLLAGANGTEQEANTNGKLRALFLHQVKNNWLNLGSPDAASSRGGLSTDDGPTLLSRCLLLNSSSEVRNKRDCSSRYSALIHWQVHGYMTSNNETVSRQMPWAGNIAKTMTWNGKQFTVTREILTRLGKHWDSRETKFTVPLGTSR